MSAPSAKASTLVPNPIYAKPATREQLDRAARHLKEHGIPTVIVADRAEALKAVLAMIPERSEVFLATSETLLQIGLTREVEETVRYESVRKKLKALDRNTQQKEMQRLGATPDVMVGSVHAVTEEGDLLIASATGSQVGPYAFGAAKMIWVVGAQKVVPTLVDGMKRLQEYSYPLEDARALKAYGMNSGLNKVLIVSREINPARAQVVLVEESLGF